MSEQSYIVKLTARQIDRLHYAVDCRSEELEGEEADLTDLARILEAAKREVLSR